MFGHLDDSCIMFRSAKTKQLLVRYTVYKLRKLLGFPYLFSYNVVALRQAYYSTYDLMIEVREGRKWQSS